MTFAGAKFALVLVAAGSLAWGCGPSRAVVRQHEWQTYEPAGGWEAYVPPSRTYAPSAARATATSPDVTPSAVSTANVTMPVVGH